jgi:glycosyltransferase involved in cell wall biosynthesis
MKRLNIGLLLTYNEADVLPQMLESVHPEIDVIYALDGSSDQTPEILKANSLVHNVLFDKEIAPNQQIKDYHRQTLLDLARVEHGYGHWYTLLHADEFFHDSPRKIIQQAELERAGFVNWMSMQFFLHLNDQGLYDQAGQPLEPNVQQRMTWYSPFWIEVRQFLDVPQFPFGQVAYRQGEHARTIPRGVGWKPLSKMPILKHYSYRSPAQMNAKYQNQGMSQANWQGTNYFRRTAEPVYRFAYQLENSHSPDFAEFEMRRQKSLLHTFLKFKRLIPN